MTIKEVVKLYNDTTNQINRIQELKIEIEKGLQKPYTGNPMHQGEFYLSWETVDEISGYLEEYKNILEKKLNEKFKE